MQQSLIGKTAIVTGASRGIGAAIAKALAEAGADVALAARDAEALAQTAASVKAAGRRALIFPMDLRDMDVCSDVVSRTVATFGRLDLLVNNAGATKRGDFLELTDEDFLDGFALKFFGAVRLSRAAWPHLIATNGSIVMIAGIGGRTPAAEFTIGGPVNSALANFAKALAERGLADGVRVNTINPGHIVTDRLWRRIDVKAQALGVTREEAFTAYLKEIGVTRFGRPEDVADLVVYLSGPKGGYFQGATLDIDGGATRGL